MPLALRAVSACATHPNGRLRLRGLVGAQDEFILAATAQNLRGMAKWLMPKSQNSVSNGMDAPT